MKQKVLRLPDYGKRIGDKADLFWTSEHDSWSDCVPSELHHQ